MARFFVSVQFKRERAFVYVGELKRLGKTVSILFAHYRNDLEIATCRKCLLVDVVGVFPDCGVGYLLNEPRTG